ncbi:MAG TPA: membrane protein insertase YidC [Candidatus Sulfotelmatobacter sp.]|nr:membrane protein insertase YidC [Candidatus Sulfotelmatobacter sp.]
MDRTGYIVVTICFILLGFWLFESEKLEKRQAAMTNSVNAVQSPAPVSAPVSPVTASAIPSSTNVPEHLLTITTNRVRYTFTSRGGGIKSIGLLDYPETISPRWQKGTGSNAVATLNESAPLPVLTILGDPSLIGDGDFTLSKTAHGVEAEKSLPNGLVLTKDFDIASNYLVYITVTFKNDSGKPLSLPQQEWIAGTATPMDVDDLNFMTYGGAMWYDGASLHSVPGTYFNPSTTVLGIIPRTPKTEYRDGNGNVVWAAAYNQFFAILAMPQTNQPASQMLANPVILSVTNSQTGVPLVGVQAALLYPAETLVADQVVIRQIALYAGPKELRTLARIGDRFQNRADLVMNFGTGFAGFFGIGSFFAKVLLSLMNLMHDLLPWLNYGWIIVVLTILLRGFFWPFTAASMRSMKRMQALAPEVNALKEKYGSDPQKFTEKQMELWRKNKVNPMSGCLPMLIQMPVFLGFFTMIRSAIELRGAHFLWVADLTKPDTIFIIPGLTFIPFFSSPQGLPFNVLPLLMVGVLVWQAHLQPPSPGMDPSQQKIMRYMPLIFLLFLYNYSAGMALYMTVSTSMGILQTRLTKNIKAAPAPLPPSPLAPQPKKKK